jgi:hypothetical protein
VAQEVKDGSHGEMEKLGIVVDALEIQEIEDASGYISNLAAPHAATVASQARIAKAHADQAAAERELAAAAMKAQFERDTAIKRAGFLAETDKAQAVAAQAGPLAQRPRSAARPTPRPTGRARWPRPAATRPGSRPRRRPTGPGHWPRPRPRRSGPGRTRCGKATPSSSRPTG